MHMAKVAAVEGIDEKRPARQCGVLKRWTSDTKMDLPPSIRTQNSVDGLYDSGVGCCRPSATQYRRYR